MFEDFPDNIQWFRYSLTKEELEKVKYIDYSYWVKLSNETRLPKVAAEEVKKGTIVFDQSNDNFIEAADALSKGVSFPTLILVGKNEDNYLVILEGHVRMTAYYLAPESIPVEIEVVVGFSDQITQWGLY